MVNPTYHLFLFYCLILLFFCGDAAAVGGNGIDEAESKTMVRVGVILDLNSTVGEMADSCISTAVRDFYSKHPRYRTRLEIHTRDSKEDVVAAASAALDLLKNLEVHAIIGPQRSTQARFVADLGEKAQVPVVSFSATSPSISPIQSPYFIRTAQNDSSQVMAITAIVQAFGWREVIPIYEDTEYGKGIIPYLSDAFQKIDTHIPYRSVIQPSANNFEILKELNNLMGMQTRVFVVHMIASLGSRLFELVRIARMMSEGYAWIITDGLSTFLDPMEDSIMDSMHGVLGVKPYIPNSESLEEFKIRWNRNFILKGKTSKFTELNLLGIWAYDTVGALAMAVEKVGAMNLSFSIGSSSGNSTDLMNLGYSLMGPKLHKTLSNNNFKGLSGNFTLVEGQLQSSDYQIFNVIGNKERVIGYWTPSKVLSQDLYVDGKAYSTSKTYLKSPIWPGDVKKQPRGWVIPVSGKKLRIGVPVKDGFKEFMDVERDPHSNNVISVSGFSVDVFHAALDALPFAVPHEFFPGTNIDEQSALSYDELLYQIRTQRFDAVVGDTTIVANRSLYVDFTLPYSESGVVMVVPIKDDESKNAWIFLKPLSWDLWLTIWAAFIFTGVVVWILEHRINTDFRGPLGQQVGMIFWFSFSTLVFAQREKVLNNWSRFVLIIWFFVVLILTQSYTASLTSMLTVQRLQPVFTDIKDLRRNGYYVGYQNRSFVKQFLVKRLNLDESKLKPYSTSEEYDKALSDGTHNGGVAAIIDEIPYIKVFLNNHCSKYTMVGPTYKSDGFGFVFPLGSPLVPYFSRAILNVTEGDKMEEIEQKYFKQEATCKDQSTLEPSNSLSIKSFWGLFLITASASVLSLLAFIIQFLRDHWHDSSPTNSDDSILTRLATIIKYFDQKDLSSHTFKTSESRAHPLGGTTVTETPTNIEPLSPSTISEQPTCHGAIEEETQEELAPDLGDQATNMPRST